MEYRVEALAAAAGVRVDTVRFYQTRGLLARPRRRGRVAVYDDAHLAQLRRVRDLVARGFKLAQIEQLHGRRARSAEDRRDATAHDEARAGTADGTRGDSSGDARGEVRGDARSDVRGEVRGDARSDVRGDELLDALVEESVGRRTLTRAELAAEAGVPEALIRAAETAGLVEPLRIDGEARFSEADVEMGRAALAILGQGFPLGDLLALAVRHASHVRAIADDAIGLFDAHVRKRDAPETAITESFRTLMPQVTRLVALHFERTLVGRALERLADAGESERGHLERALADTARRLDVQWR